MKINLDSGIIDLHTDAATNRTKNALAIGTTDADKAAINFRR